MAVMKASEFVAKLKDVAQNYKTLYVMGCFGAPLTGGNVSRYCNNHAYNKQAARTKMIKAAANQNPPVFGFDCVCLIKGILWGWRGDASKTYGGASYAVNGVPDIGADTMITKCKGVSTNFSNVEVGEALWCSGHIGVYIGGGLAVECSPPLKTMCRSRQLKTWGQRAGITPAHGRSMANFRISNTTMPPPFSRTNRTPERAQAAQSRPEASCV